MGTTVLLAIVMIGGFAIFAWWGRKTTEESIRNARHTHRRSGQRVGTPKHKSSRSGSRRTGR